jgi:hypothetical protein
MTAPLPGGPKAPGREGQDHDQDNQIKKKVTEGQAAHIFAEGLLPPLLVHLQERAAKEARREGDLFSEAVIHPYIGYGDSGLRLGWFADPKRD